MLLITLSGVEVIKVGEDVLIGVHKKGNKTKLSFIAPKDIEIYKADPEEWEKKAGRPYIKDLSRRGE